jgi:glycyl-tRNA synthetase (class II)
MYERLKNNNTKPNYEEAMEFIGTGKELFEKIDSFLVNELNAEKEIEFSNHDKCWEMGYRVKERLICGIYFEKDAVFVVIKFSLAKDNIKGFEDMYNSLSQYAKVCVDSSPWRHVGFVEYRVLTIEHLDDLKIMLKCRANEKQKRKQIK